MEADITLGKDGAGLVFNGPGEYESKGVVITGIKRNGDTIYHITMDGVRVVYLGLSQKNLTDEESEEIDETDILILGLGSVKAVAQLEPKIIIPIPNGEDRTKFLKELGAEGGIPQAKLSMTKDKLPTEPMVAILSHAKSA